ncbi:MAG: preprotein translocase subunit SecG [Anaerolineaceae bacterium]|nr:MAG: preprotein translocase subunit SecG [Anaerolineaceae bacterium]
MGWAFQIASIVMAVILIVLIMMQVRGGSLGSLMGGDSGGGITRTRRGLEKTVYNFTVGLAIAFLIICILSVVYN